ncbi:hypothetical protein [Parabacteroides merdae]|uniref:hypothetical protein n=1 Tax=Parabacteroides merdae TaxID=46503 RepID=UPI003D08A48B
MNNLDNLITANDWFNAIKFNVRAQNYALGVYNRFRYKWNIAIINNEKDIHLSANICDMDLLVGIMLYKLSFHVAERIIENERLDDDKELAMKIVTLFFMGDRKFSNFRYENGDFVYENPIYTEMDGYNNINETFENLIDWQELWLEYLSQNNMSKKEYPLEEYAKDNGYIPLGEYKKDFLY